MPQARPPLAPLVPFPVEAGEALFIKRAIRRFYGEDAVVRSFGADRGNLMLHVEASQLPEGHGYYDCLGIICAKIDRDRISLCVTKRGQRIRGEAKIAYRQGVVL
ncbi:hypothetical protein [Bradyrhizobium cosmicum]|nr:hypothetical protein [Bradyrhizobium cosmicum]